MSSKQNAWSGALARPLHATSSLSKRRSAALLLAIALAACAKQDPAPDASQPEAAVDVKGATGAVLRICADPGNMPLSNQAGEGYQNRIAQLLGKSMGMPVEYYWRTYYERGLARGTINSGKCDVLMDMPEDYEQGLTTKPYFRSTYVLVSPRDKPVRPASFPCSTLSAPNER